MLALRQNRYWPSQTPQLEKPELPALNLLAPAGKTQDPAALRERSERLGQYEGSVSELSDSLGVDCSVVREGLGRVKKTLQLAVLTTVAAASVMMAEASAPPSSPQKSVPAAVAGPPAGSVAEAVAAMPITKESVDSILSQLGGDAVGSRGWRDVLWGKLPDGEKRWWGKHVESMGLTSAKNSLGESVSGREAVRLNAKKMAEVNYGRWAEAGAQNKRDFFTSLDGWERSYWLGKSISPTPEITEGMTQEQARQQVQRYMNLDGESWDKAEEQAQEHYRRRNIRPMAPVSDSEVKQSVTEEVNSRFSRIEEARILLSKFQSQSDEDKALLAKANKRLFNDTAIAASPNNYSSLIPLERQSDEEMIRSLDAIESAFREGVRSQIRGMAGGERRIEILDKHGIAVLDGPAAMTVQEVDVLGDVLKNTPPHIKPSEVFGGGIIKDVSRESDVDKQRGLETLAEHTTGWHMVRFPKEVNRGTAHHEVGHGVHDLIGDEKFSEFARLGGWKMKDKDGTVTEIPKEHAGPSLHMRSEFYVKPPETSVVRPYGLTNPSEDFTTLYQAYTDDTAALIKSAAEREDKTLLRKVGWMMDNVMRDPESGKYYIYEDGKMRGMDDVQAYINGVLKREKSVEKPETVYKSKVQDF